MCKHEARIQEPRGNVQRGAPSGFSESRRLYAWTQRGRDVCTCLDTAYKFGVGHPLIYINRLTPPLSPPPRSLCYRTVDDVFHLGIHTKSTLC